VIMTPFISYDFDVSLHEKPSFLTDKPNSHTLPKLKKRGPMPHYHFNRRF